jgi:predicted nucleic acid-binding protein
MAGWTLYLDTSVFGGYFDKEFRADTRALWEEIRRGDHRICFSDLVADELRQAPARVRRLFDELSEVAKQEGGVLWVAITPEMLELAEAYVTAGVVSRRFYDDALHVATATIFGARIVVSWNFAHLVNVRREAGFNSVNLAEGFSPIRIVSPKEVISYGRDE